MDKKNIYQPLVKTVVEQSDSMSMASGRYSEVDDTEPFNLSFQSLTVSSALDPSIVTAQTKALNLDYNRFLTLPDSICDMVHLRVLSISSQLDLERIADYRKPALQELPKSINKLEALSELILTNNALQRLPESMSHMKHLQVLDLRMNLLQQFPECICYMKSLITLRLCGNELEQLSTSITKLKHLVTLTVSQNKLIELPDNIGLLLDLEHVDVRSNQLTSLPRSLCDIYPLAISNKLFLGNNPLEYPSLDVVTKGAKAVLKFLREDVDVRLREQGGARGRGRRETHISKKVTSKEQTELSALMQQKDAVVMKNGQYEDRELHPIGLTESWNFSKIRCVNVSSNSIDRINPEIKKLNKLETLILDDNHVTQFPDHVIREMKNLRMFSLNKQTSPSMDGVYGPLHCLPRDLVYIGHLTHLHVAKNQLTRVPEEIKHMKNLEELDLTDNKFITVIPEGIGKLVRLKYLGLSGNRIERLPASIGKLTNLQVLRLSCNQLQFLPEEICGLKELMTLSLGQNKLIYLPLNFDRLTSLANAEPKTYSSPLMERREFQQLLDLKKNIDIQFPCRDCHDYSAQKLFEMYTMLRQQGDETMLEHLQEAKEQVKDREEVGAARQWQYLDDALLSGLSRGIGFDWRRLGYQLEFTHGHLEQFVTNHPGDIAGSITEMFIRWRDQCAHKNMSEKTMIDQMLRAMEDIENLDLKGRFMTMLRQTGWKQ